MNSAPLLQRWLLLAATCGCAAFCPAGAAAPAASEAQALALNATERAWVAAHPVVRVGYDPAWPPFSVRSPEGGFSGIDADLLALLAKRLGLQVEYVARGTWSEIYEAARRGECDVLAGTAKTPEREKHFRFSQPYLTFPVVIVMRNDEPILWSPLDLAGRRLAGVKDYAPTTELARLYPSFHYQYVATVREAMEAVSTDEADAFVTNLPNASFIAKTRGLTNLKIAGVMPDRFDLRYAVRPDWPELAGLLDKAIASLSEEDRQAIIHPWIRVDYE